MAAELYIFDSCVLCVLIKNTLLSFSPLLKSERVEFFVADVGGELQPCSSTTSTDAVATGMTRVRGSPGHGVSYFTFLTPVMFQKVSEEAK